MKWVKLTLAAIGVILIILFIRACSGIYGNDKKNVIENSTKKFTKEIRDEYPMITGIQFYTTKDHLIIDYSINEKIDNNGVSDIEKIFNMSYNFISSDESIQKILTQQVKNQNAHTVWIYFRFDKDLYLYKSEYSSSFKNWTVEKNGIDISTIEK